MCTNYAAARKHIFEKYYGVPAPEGEWSDDIYKDYPAPIVVRGPSGEPEAMLATFGMVPRKRIPAGVKVFDTMNCRSETVGEKRSFSGAWRAAQLCLIPCEAFYEPNYESGKAVRWRIGLASGEPFAIAGLWRAWNEPDGVALSFSMLTLDAQSHSLLRRFHKPGTEKRGIVILGPEQYGEWLACRDPEVARTFLNLFPADLMAAQAAPVRLPITT